VTRFLRSMADHSKKGGVQARPYCTNGRCFPLSLLYYEARSSNTRTLLSVHSLWAEYSGKAT